MGFRSSGVSIPWDIDLNRLAFGPAILGIAIGYSNVFAANRFNFIRLARLSKHRRAYSSSKEDRWPNLSRPNLRPHF